MRIASNTLKTGLPTSSRRRAFIYGARRSVLRAKGFFKVFENGGNSLQLCFFEQYINCLLLTTPKLGRGKKVNYNRLYTIGKTSLKSLPSMSILRDCYVLQKEFKLSRNINEKMNEIILRQNMA